jgi:ferredoxin
MNLRICLAIVRGDTVSLSQDNKRFVPELFVFPRAAEHNICDVFSKLRRIITSIVLRASPHFRMALARPLASFLRFGSVSWVPKSGAQQSIPFENDQNLFEVLTKSEAISKTGTCHGHLAWGKCVVGYVSGKVAPAGNEEKDLLGDRSGRLACAIVLGDDADGAVFKEI